jgi:hypothetical protein
MYIQLFKLLIRFHLTFCRTNRLDIIFLLFLNCFRRTRNTGHQWKIAPLFFSIRTSFGCCCYKGCIPFLTFKLYSITTLHLLDIIKYYFLILDLKEVNLLMMLEFSMLNDGGSYFINYTFRENAKFTIDVYRDT